MSLSLLSQHGYSISLTAQQLKLIGWLFKHREGVSNNMANKNTGFRRVIREIRKRKENGVSPTQAKFDAFFKTHISKKPNAIS